MKSLTIGQLAKQAHVNIETIRYYERRGVIPEPPRRASGYRQYSPDTVGRMKFIKRAQELGFSLKEIQELLSLRVDPGIFAAKQLITALGGLNKGVLLECGEESGALLFIGIATFHDVILLRIHVPSPCQAISGPDRAL